MQAAVITKFGGPEVFKIQEREIPTPTSNEVLIKVKYAGINRPDVFQRKGNYPAPKDTVQDIPGLEVAGIVLTKGSNAERFQVGDEVMVLLSGGGYANYVCASQDTCILKPTNLSFEEAASLPETIFTVWHNLFRLGQLKANETVLIQGGSGGIGSMSIQLANLYGANVITTVGSDQKKNYVMNLGASTVINYKTEDFAEILQDKGVDVILDSIGGNYFAKHMDIINYDGRLIQINASSGGKVPLNILQLMQKRILLTGSTLRSRDIAFKSELREAIEANVLPLLLNGKLRPMVTKVFALAEVSKAHEFIESDDFYGKIVLTM